MKTIFEQPKDTSELFQQMEQYFLQKAQNNLIFEKDKEKIHEEFSYLCRGASKQNIEVYAKSFQTILDMDYEEGFFPIIATNHNNKEALEFFFENFHDVYNKYYTNLVNAAVFNQSTDCQDFLNSHTIEVSGVHEQHIDSF
jgi:hypothetical protein